MRELPNPRAFPVDKHEGMTLMDYFAGQAASSMMATASSHEVLYYDVMAEDAYKLAEAMLKERQKLNI